MRKVKAASFLFMVSLAAVPSAASAQGTDASRAVSLAAERERKASETNPPHRSAVERALYWYDNQYVLAKIVGGWNGVHLAGGDFPAGAGTKFGLGFTRTIGSAAPGRPNRVDIDTVAAYSTRGYARSAASLAVRGVAGAPLDVRLRGQFTEFPQEDFFGFGQDSRTDDRTNYLLDSTEAGVDVHWKPITIIDLAGGASFVSPTVGSGTDSRFLSTEQVFDRSATPGLADQPDFLRTDASIALDWRNNPRHPRAGGQYGVLVSDFHDRDSSTYGFRRVAIDLQQYVPLSSRNRTVALRAVAVLTDAHAGQDVPFYYQPTLGGSQTLRGFRESRFRDRNSLSLTAEYRWEASWLLDGALFVDAGTVGFNRRNLALHDLDLSYGVGFRVHSNSAFVARLDLAVSREGFIPLLRFEHVF